ncbi:hypothetical protein [Halorussus ruber]|uniref:hypothetical protein n=1 Tax=Halorussus ruber TaxID=1126238 RepID=UPI0010926C26|nr:hypothetical protein [Halorussus ruber]
MTVETPFETDFRFDCPACDAVLRSEAVEELKRDGRRHLKDHDYQEVSAAFAETYSGTECENDCGYVYPVVEDETSGFGCPNCGFDHRHEFARRYLYWHIETI